LNIDAKIIEKLYNNWKDKATYTVTLAYKELKNQEITIFDRNKLYFQNMESKQVLEEDDLEYLSTSDKLVIID
jgi:hypothetical protein